MKLKTLMLFVVALVVIGGGYASGFTVTNATLDTANDLLDIGGGTPFYCNSAGERDLSGGFPWNSEQGHGTKLYDNVITNNNYAQTQWNDTSPTGLAGVVELSMPYELGGFAVTISSLRQQGYNFTIQGSSDSSAGYDGNWTDIYSYSGNLSEDTTYRWNASRRDPFLTREKFTAFRLVEPSQYKRYAEIEFFAMPPPEATVIMVR